MDPTLSSWIEGIQDSSFYKIDFPAISFIVKALKLNQAQAFKVVLDINSQNLSLVDRIEDEIFKIGVVEVIPPFEDEDDFNYLKAGIVSTVAMIILKISAPPDTAEELKSQFDELDASLSKDTVNDMRLIICSAFNYKPEDLSDWTWIKLLTRFIEAQKILSGRLLVTENTSQLPQTRTIVDPRTKREIDIQEFVIQRGRPK